MLRRQLYHIFIFSLLLPILVIGAILLYNNYNMLYNHHKDMIASDNIRIRSIIFEVTTSVTNLSDAILKDESLHLLLSTNFSNSEDSKNALEEFDMINNYYKRHTDVSSITLYTDNTTLSSYGHIKVIGEENKEWFYNTINQPGYHWSTLSRMNQYGIVYQELQLVRPISINNSDYKAIIVISVSNNYLKNIINNNKLEVDITVNHDPIFYSTWGNANKIIDFNDYNQNEYYHYSGNTEFLGEYTLLEASTISPIKTNDKIYVFSSNPKAMSEINRIMLSNFLIVIMSFLIPTIIIIKYTKQLTNRVNTLKTEMNRVTMGDYNIIENFKGNDELVDLFKNLQEMIHSIKIRDQAIFESEIKKQKLINHQQKMELDLLSSKINPHFLYNTLETIRMKAVSSEDLEVAESIKLLGRYMRYNLESTGNVTTLSSEMYYINIYLKIQKLRFSNRIRHLIHIDDSLCLDEVSILPLLIQPIVENAFIHGHKETIESGKIEVNILDQGELILIQVIDNGIGITNDQLHKLKLKLSGSNESNRTSFGMYNIHHRLQLFYGESYGLEIISEVNKGTTVQFAIPKSLNK